MRPPKSVTIRVLNGLLTIGTPEPQQMQAGFVPIEARQARARHGMAHAVTSYLNDRVPTSCQHCYLPRCRPPSQPHRFAVVAFGASFERERQDRSRTPTGHDGAARPEWHRAWSWRRSPCRI
jgi:hypothetical protein